MKKKLFALLFVALLSVSFVTGCGSKKDDKKEEKKDTEEKEEIKGEEFDLVEATNLINIINDKTGLVVLDQGVPKLTLAIKMSESNEKKRCEELFDLGESGSYTVKDEKYSSQCQRNESLNFYNYDDVNNVYKDLFNEEAPKTNEFLYSSNGGHNGCVGYSDKLNGYAKFNAQSSVMTYYSAFKVDSAYLKDDILTIELTFNSVNCYMGCGVNTERFDNKDDALAYANQNVEQGEKLTVKYKKIDGKFYLIDSKKSE